MVDCQDVSVGVSQGPSANQGLEGRLPKGGLPVPKEVNRKKMAGTSAASPTPPGSHGLRAPGVSYRHSF